MFVKFVYLPVYPLPLSAKYNQNIQHVLMLGLRTSTCYWVVLLYQTTKVTLLTFEVL